MSEHWEFFPSQMGDGIGTVLYDHGLSETIDSLPIQQSVRFFLKFKTPDDRGWPGEAESAIADEIESQIEARAAELAGLYTGRITFDGQRYFYSYLDADETTIKSMVDDLMKEFDYEITFDKRDDPAKEDYWRDLFPTAETWQFMQNSRVLRALEETGDSLTQPRRIDHWCSFPDESARQQFSIWLSSQGFEIETSAADDNDSFGVQFFRNEVPEVSAITQLTIQLNEQADELDGTYDGWESLVVNENT